MRAALQGRGLQLVGEAGDGHQTLALAVDTEPDVVVLDLGMPGADGPDLIAELRRRLPAVRVVALSPFAGSEPPGQAGERGAHATLGKDVDPDRLVATVREVCGRAFGPVALPPPDGLEGLAGDELERVWGTLAAAPVATAVVGPTAASSGSTPPCAPWSATPSRPCWPPAAVPVRRGFAPRAHRARPGARQPRGPGPRRRRVRRAGHLRRGSLRVAKGQRVAAGEQVAECGSSGNSTEPHLHFQLQDHPSVLFAAVPGRELEDRRQR